MKNEPLLFRERFNPFNKRITKRIIQNEFWGETPAWITLEEPLTNNKILEAVYGKKIIGYFSTGYSPAFGIDIDAHNGEGLEYSKKIYAEVRERLHFPASVLCISTGGAGLHCFYFMTRPLPFLVIQNALYKTLDGLKVEIKPTTNQSLRIPPKNSFLFPETLETDHRAWRVVIAEAEQREPFELFDALISPDAMRSQYKKKGISRKLYNLEGKLSPILPGNTNEAVYKLGYLYARSHVPIEYAVNRFRELLHPHYQGELRQGKRLYERFKNVYRKHGRGGIIQLHREPELFDTDEITAGNIADKFIKALPPEMFEKKKGKYGTIKKNLFQKLLKGIILWHKYLNEIYCDNVWRSYWNYCYPGFAHNVKRGFYPLPYSVLKKYIGKPGRFYIQILQETGFLKKAFWKHWFDFSGNGRGGGCNHYQLPLLVNALDFKKTLYTLKTLETYGKERTA